MKWVVLSVLLSWSFEFRLLCADSQTKNLQFRDVAKDLRCPTCTGLSVLGSDAKFSVQIKDQVKLLLEEGKSRDEILAFFVERFGPWILREPPKKGLGVLAWILPIAVLFLGPILVWVIFWRRQTEIETFGARAADDILAEMNQSLEEMRARL